MASVWRNFQRIVDSVVDVKFSEPVELHPWVSTQNSYTSLGMADTSRDVLRTTGVYVQPGAAVTGEGGTMGGEMSARIVSQDVWLSITLDKLGDVTAWKKNDRVFFPERNEWYSISWIDQSATDRPNIHLVRLPDGNAPY